MDYFAYFLPAKEGGYVIKFPDIPEATTQGKDIAEALEMADDALLTCMTEFIKEGRPLPTPSSKEAVKLKLQTVLEEDAEYLDPSRQAQIWALSYDQPSTEEETSYA